MGVGYILRLFHLHHPCYSYRVYLVSCSALILSHEHPKQVRRKELELVQMLLVSATLSYFKLLRYLSHIQPLGIY